MRADPLPGIPAIEVATRPSGPPPYAELTALPAWPGRVLGDRSHQLAALERSGEIRGEAGELTVLHEWTFAQPARTLVAGLGDAARADDAACAAAAAVARYAVRVGARSIAWDFRPAEHGLSGAALARALVDGTAAGLAPAPLRAAAVADSGPPRPGAPAGAAAEPGAGPLRLALCGPQAEAAADAARDAARVARWATWCRALVDGPPNVVDPCALADAARRLAAAHPALAVDVLDAARLEAEGFPALHAIGRGTPAGASLVVLRHEPAEAPAAPLLALVGKGVTYDAGGLCLKTPDQLRSEKSDMAGGAAVLAAIGAIAELQLPLRVLALLPAFENVPDGDACRPGSVVATRGGLTVEVTNSDAEGRLALADALVYARDLGATRLVDAAALTGAIVDALGDRRSGLFASDDALAAALERAGEASRDRVWRMPLDPVDRDYLASGMADLANVAPTRHAGAIQGALFLAAFAGDVPWAHVDLAGAAYTLRERADELGGAGATGHGVRLLVELARAEAAAAAAAGPPAAAGAPAREPARAAASSVNDDGGGE